MKSTEEIVAYIQQQQIAAEFLKNQRWKEGKIDAAYSWAGYEECYKDLLIFINSDGDTAVLATPKTPLQPLVEALTGAF